MERLEERLKKKHRSQDMERLEERLEKQIWEDLERQEKYFLNLLEQC